MILDLIKKYRETKTYLKSSQSSRRKLIAIINFFKDCERLNHYPPNASFIIEFTPIIINIFKTSSVNFISPEYFESSKLILTPAKNYYKDEIILNQINITLDYINMHLLKLYFYLGEYEEGLIVLQKMVSGSSYKEVANDNIQSDIRRKKESKSKNVNKYSIVSKDFFKKYRAFEILEEIKYELDRLNSFSSEEINVLLIEDANYNDNKNNFGVIQSFICDIAKGKNQNNIFQFDNITDLDEDTLHNSLGDLQSVLKLLIQKFNKKILPHNILIDLHFNNLSGIYKGSSFLLPAAILSFCNYQKYINNICSFKINSSAAFSSSLDSKGNLVKLPYDSLKIKTHTAFYSWIKYIIIPKENLYDAKDIYKELHLKYPKKELNIIGIENVTDIFGHNEIINIKKDTVYNHTKKFVKRNSTLSLTVFSLFILFLGVFLALKIIPRDIKPLPKPESEMYLIYAPDRDTSWIFKNENLFSGDTIDFGDVAIGDQWYPKIEFWNNSRTTDDFKIEIEGKDKNEFEILWRDEGNQNLAPKLKPDFMQRLYIKYRPLDYNNLGEKNAKLVFSPLSKPENKKTIILKGNSVRYKSGYSVLFDNANKQLVLNNKQNILGDVFSIEFWVKPLRANSEGDYWIFNNADGTNNKFNISISKDSLIYIGIYESKAIDKYNILYSKEKVLYNKWNHFAVIYNKGNVNVLLNGSDFRYYLKNNPIKNIPDRIFIGGTKGPEKRKLEVFNNSGGKFLLNGLTIWGSSLDPEYMLKNKMSRKKEKEDDLILYYDFNEMNFEAVYDLSKNDIWATILGGVNRKMDSPLNIEEKKNIVTGNKRKGNCL
ncbi:MAG: hypothetical protein NTU73_13490 [Ignavibacteriae bacterium]|nr:hypothetical protein [Ignavibacteriota bacterium]